jgi:tRNA 2-thiouridine synthesizing protein B
MLHTLSHSPWQCDIARCFACAQGDDLLLLLMACLRPSKAGFLEILQCPHNPSALQDDIDARGLAGQIADSVVRVGYTDFVRLTVKHAGQLAW